MSFQIDKAELFHVSNFFHNPTSSQSNYFNKKLEKKITLLLLHISYKS